MNTLLQQILGSLLSYQYAALFVLTFLSSLGFPLPAGPSTVAAAAFASQGYLNIYVVVLVAGLGNIGGDMTMYWLMRLFGRNVLYKLGLRKLADSVALQTVEQTVSAYKTPVVIMSRFQVQATAVINVLAGLGRMHFRKFAPLVLIGETAQVVFYCSIGYMFADSWQVVYAAVGKFAWLIALTVGIVMTVAAERITKRILRKKDSI